MNTRKPLLLCILVLFATIMNGTPAWSQNVPDRCIFAYASASFRMATLASLQITNLSGQEAIGDAQRAVQLAINLKCPQKPMTDIIDCAIKKTIESGGKKMTEVQNLDCVEKHLGRPIPQLGK